MDIIKCKICGSITRGIFNAQILCKYNVKYHYCDDCGFLQTEYPFWLKESYQDSINLSDTGLISRNLYLSKVTAIIIYFMFDKNARFLDFAGGFGILVRLMRDIGFDFYWNDLYTKNLFARGFANETNKKVELITCFEAFEHFVEPLEEIETMMKISKNIVFSTVILPNSIPKPHEWWYYGLEHGQHISFYSMRTLRYLAKKYGLNFYSMNGIYMLTEKNLNPLILKLLVRLHNLGLFEYVLKNMKSKTFEDMQNICIKLNRSKA
ncbi:Methyltransferase domain protein [uncultured archaeon]|nr:Methyltransferase domain protein [uncultured archaeon]